MSQNLTELNLDSLATVTGGAACCAKGGCPQKPAKKNVAQNGGTGYVDHTYGFGDVVQGGRYSYATPNGFGGSAAWATGDKLNVSSGGALPL
jgi:hypothetical protein